MCHKCDSDRRLNAGDRDNLAPVQVGDIIRSIDIDVVYDAGLEYLGMTAEKQAFSPASRHYAVIDSTRDKNDLIISIRIITSKGQLTGPAVPVLMEHKQQCVFPTERIQVVQRTGLQPA